MWPISIGITDEMRTERRDRFEAGGSLGQRNAPLKAYNGDAITRSDCP
jgi:hypothetical protein